MKTVKNLLWKLAVKSVKFLFSGIVTLISAVEILAKMKGDAK